MSNAHHGIEPEVHNGVNTLDEPSAKWGWHSIGFIPTQVGGWFAVFVLLAYNFGNHKGHVETIYLFLFAIVIALLLLLQIFAPRLKQVRTVSAHNKPHGHVEPVWTADQQNMTGAYANLTDSQLRALNVDPEALHARGGTHRTTAIEH